MNLNQIADNTIPLPLNKRILVYKNGETRDIIREVLATYKDCKDQLRTFAPALKGNTVLDTCRNIWHFWKDNIRYVVDPEGVQKIVTPAAFWASKYGDCKSFSVAVAATLHALGIDGKFRFTSYGGNTKVPTHVYVIAMHRGKEIIIDCVWNEFNSEKQFTKNWDYNMTAIFRIAGLTTAPAKGRLDINVNDDTTTQAELDIALDKQRLEIEQIIARRTNGIGSLLDNAYQTEIEAHSAALGAIGKVKKGKAPAAPKANKRTTKKTAKATKANDGTGVNKKQAKLLAKAGVTVKKRKESIIKRVAKGIVKVIATPLRLAAKTQLPKNAPFFLYLFITDKRVLAKLPEAVSIKRAKAIKFKDLLVNKLQMKESNFNTTIRNGIMSQLGQSPEDILAKWMKSSNYNIGVLPLLAQAGQGLKSLLGNLGEKFNADVEQYSPTPEDWTGAVSAELAEAVKNQPSNDPLVRLTEPDRGSGYQVQLPPVNSNSGGSTVYTDPAMQLGEDGRPNDPEQAGQPQGETELARVKLEDEVIVRTTKPARENDNTMLYVIGGAAILLLASSKK